MSTVIPQTDPRANYRAHQAEIDAAVHRVLESDRYILGQECSALEDEFAAFCQVGHGVGVGSGTDALHLALRACGLGPGGEVITVSHTAVASVAAIEMSGARPVLVDVDPIHLTIDPAQVAAALTPRTQAIVPVHLYGCPAEMAPLIEIARQRDLFVVEDCAQAHGASYHGRPVGAWGHVAAFSFYPTKNLGALGDGGMIVTDNATLAERARLLRQYGWQERYVSHVKGTNSRLDELQAAILRVKLRYLAAENERRRHLARLYDERLRGNDLILPQEPQETMHVYHLYVVRHPQRDELADFLRQRSIGSLIHYPLPVHLQPAYADLGIRPGKLPVSETAARQVLSLPLYPEMADEDVVAVAEAVNCFCERAAQ